MHRFSAKIILLFLGLTTYGVATAGRGIPAPQPPMIVKTAVDVPGRTLIITGRNFGASAPTVILADQIVEVKRFSEREVVVSLPRSLPAATYGVSVTTTGRNQASSNLFSATVPSAGEAGL